MLEEHADDEQWRNKVRVIAISVDQNPNDVYKHVKKRGWYKVESYHKGASTCGICYSINAVPYCMMLDKSGKIAYKGHPGSRDNIEDDLIKLLNDEELVGEGCVRLRRPKNVDVNHETKNGDHETIKS